MSLFNLSTRGPTDASLHMSSPQEYLTLNLSQHDISFAKVEDFAYNQRGNNIYNSSSEVTSEEWNGLLRLLSYSFFSAFGSMGSIFIISALTVVNSFQVRGNVYLASLSLGHLIITVFVLPASVVAIMSGQEKDPVSTQNLCHYQWLGTIVTLLVHTLSFMFISIESFKGLGNPLKYDYGCTKFRIIVTTLITWFLSITVVVAQHINKWGPEVCSVERTKGRPWQGVHTLIAGGMVLMPTLLTIIFFGRSLVRAKRYRLIMNESPQNPIFFVTDENLLKSHVAVYSISILMWIPLCVIMVIDHLQPMNQDAIKATWAIAIGYSCCYSFVYAFTNRDFGESFMQLFYYCCCKSHINWVRKTTVGVGFNAAPQRGTVMTAPATSMPVGMLATQRAHHNHGTGATGMGMVSMGGGVSGGGICGGGPFRAFRGQGQRATEL